MKQVTLLFTALTVWTYGSESMDILAARGEWESFQLQLQCKTVESQVWCLVGRSWATMENGPLPIPWGME